MAVEVTQMGTDFWRNTVSSAPVVSRLREPEPRVEPMGSRGQPSAEEALPWINSAYEDKKKDKKWSIGKLFRRRKKDSDTESATSDDNSQKQKKKKAAKKSKSKEPDEKASQRSQSVNKVTKKDYYDEGVLSDPSAGFASYVGRGLPRSPFERSHKSSRESFDKRGADSSCGSQDGSIRKGRKGRIKARVEAIRNLKNESSSDEESQRSNSSSIVRFRSDDSLTNHSKADLNSKKSRSARTDRYMKRLSRDEEVSNENETETIQRILSKESVGVLGNPQMNGIKRDPREEPEYYELHKPYSIQDRPQRSMSGSQLMNVGLMQGRTNLKPSVLTGSNSSVYSYPMGYINFNAKVNNENVNYSVPYNRQSNDPNYRTQFVNGSVNSENSYENENVMVVKFPLGNMTRREGVEPPVPPPRDPQRKVCTPLSYMYDNSRPLSHHFDQNGQRIRECRSNVQTPNENGIKLKENGLMWNKRPISSSEDHIALHQNYQNVVRPQFHYNNPPKRPSSVTGEVIRPELYNRYLARPSVNQEPVVKNQYKTYVGENQNYVYFTDKTPRSRKPIHISPGYNVDMQNVNNVTNKQQPRNASEFWKKMDNQEVQRRRQFGTNRTMSDQAINGNETNHSYANKPFILNQNINMNPSKTHLTNGDLHKQTDKIKNGVLENKKENVKKEEPICYSNIDIIPMDDIRKPKKSKSGNNSDEDITKARKKSTNLDDALSELEAIYNSLGLGDEDLLDRAEKRELMTPKATESFPFDLRENYFRFPNYSTTAELSGRRNQMNRRSSIPDKLHDDMAFRRLNPHERPKSKDVNSLVSQISYMLASPVLLEPLDNVPKVDSNSSEPDIVLDDVAFRNIRQANNYLKIIDPQPPFGIPLGPVSPAPHSDYLHAVPDIKYRQFSHDEPDLVTDDLAFRALRKDCKNNDDEQFINKVLNQPSAVYDNHVIKKKRAVRSLSANLFTMIQKEIDDALQLYNNRPIEKAQSIPDLPETVPDTNKNGKLLNNCDTSVKEGKNELFNVSSRFQTNIENGFVKGTEKCNEKPARGSTPIPLPSRSPKKYNDSNAMYGSFALETKDDIKFEQSTKNDQKQNLYPMKVTIENKFKSDFHPQERNNFSIDCNTVLYKENPHKIRLTQQTNINNDERSKSAVASENIFAKNNSEKQDKKNTVTMESKGKCTEDSLIEISNHLNKIGDKLKPNIDLQNNFEEEGMKLQALAKRCDIDLNDNIQYYHPYKEDSVPYRSNFLSKFRDPKEFSSNIKDVKDMNIVSNNFGANGNVSIAAASDALDKMPSFEDLRKGINELLHGISQVTDKLNLQKSGTCDLAVKPKDNDARDQKALEGRKESPLPDDDNDKSKDNRDSPEYNSSEELAMIFNLNKEDTNTKTDSTIVDKGVTDLDSHLDLNSPRLVKTVNQNLIRQSSVEREEGESSKQIANIDSNSNDVPWRKHRRQPSTTDNSAKGACDDLSTSKSNTWSQDCEFLMLACLFTMAYTQQLAGLDILTLLGLVLATISIISMLIL